MTSLTTICERCEAHISDEVVRRNVQTAASRRSLIPSKLTMSKRSYAAEKKEINLFFLFHQHFFIFGKSTAIKTNDTKRTRDPPSFRPVKGMPWIKKSASAVVGMESIEPIVSIRGSVNINATVMK